MPILLLTSFYLTNFDLIKTLQHWRIYKYILNILNSLNVWYSRHLWTANIDRWIFYLYKEHNRSVQKSMLFQIVSNCYWYHHKKLGKMKKMSQTVIDVLQCITQFENFSITAAQKKKQYTGASSLVVSRRNSHIVSITAIFSAITILKSAHL